MFRHLSSHRLRDVILAVAVAYRDQQRRMPGGYLAGPGDVPLEHLKRLLFDVEAGALHDAISVLVKERLLEPVLASYGEHAETTGVRATPVGEHRFRGTVRRTLGMSEDETILDERRLTELLLFYVWQSDDGRSRKEIEAALGVAIDRIARDHSPTSPLRIELASRPGDGAARIDPLLFARIDASQIVVADVTPTAHAHRRKVPNPNVLVEVGYAMARHGPEKIVLVESIPISDASGRKGSPLPFDIDHCRRLRYQTDDELSSKLTTELHAVLARQGLLRVPSLS